MHSKINNFISRLLPNHGVDFSKLDTQIQEREVEKGEYLFYEVQKAEGRRQRAFMNLMLVLLQCLV
jgi:hypothetical protein